MKFSAAVLTELGEPLELINNIEVPALQSGQVLVEMAYAGVCHSQLMEVKGKRGPDKYLPHLLGHEGTGMVVDTGPGVTGFKPGDRVVLGWIKGAGINAGGTQYRSPRGTLNAGPVTTFNTMAVVAENRCTKLPNTIGLREGILFGCALPTGMGMLNRHTQLSPNSTIAVYGLGGVGLAALIAATHAYRQKQCRWILALDVNPDKRSLALKLGASIALDPSDPTLPDHIRTNTKQNGVDFCIEAAGQCHTIEHAFSLLNKNGKLIFASHPPSGETIKLDPHELISGKRIEGSWGGQCTPTDILGDCDSSEIQADLQLLLSQDYPLANVNEALNDLATQQVTRAVIKLAQDHSV